MGYKLTIGTVRMENVFLSCSIAQIIRFRGITCSVKVSSTSWRSYVGTPKRLSVLALKNRTSILEKPEVEDISRMLISRC